MEELDQVLAALPPEEGWELRLAPLRGLLASGTARYAAALPPQITRQLYAEVDYVINDGFPRSYHWSSWLDGELDLAVKNGLVRLTVSRLGLTEAAPFGEDEPEDGCDAVSLEEGVAAYADSLRRRAEALRSGAAWSDSSECLLCEFGADEGGYCRVHGSVARDAEARRRDKDAKVAELQSRALYKLQELDSFLREPMPTTIEESYSGGTWDIDLVFRRV